jgi:hypothetical protein
VTTQVKKILIYMAASRRELQALASKALENLRESLRTARQADRKAGKTFARAGGRVVEVHGLVHGYQLEGGDGFGSSRFSITLHDDLLMPLASDSKLSFIPGDETEVAEWVTDSLSTEKGESLDSTMLVFWGHGSGVGTTLTVPRSVPSGSSNVAIRRPCLMNIGGLKDGALVRELSDQVPPRRDTKRFDILVFDSCLMAGAELAFEYRDLASYVVASQALVEAAPGGAPGLNMGEVLTAFLKEAAWRGPDGARGDVAGAATDIAELVGDGRSGAEQLTVFALAESRWDGACAAKVRAAADEWLSQHRLDLENAELRARNIELLQGGKRERKPADRPRILRAAELLKDKAKDLGVPGLLLLFARLLTEASFEPAERQRILLAFRGASFRGARQFLDLRDLARQVHQICQNRLLQLVALALFSELGPREDGFVLAHRAAVPLREKGRLSGVSIYCPWFRARGTDAEPHTFDVSIDHARYRRLNLPETTGWADFVFGPLFEATAEERKVTAPPSAPWGYADLIARLLQTGVVVTPNGLGEGKPSNGNLGEGKPSNGNLAEGKPSGGTLGPRDFSGDDDTR